LAGETELAITLSFSRSYQELLHDDNPSGRNGQAAVLETIKDVRLINN
jgi:hypothetical protein